MADEVQLEVDASVARVTLNKPEAGNALTMPELKLLRSCIAEAAATPQVHVLVLKARGAQFCAGRAAPPGPPQAATPEAMRSQMIAPILDLYRVLHQIDIVSVAQVQGDAHGLGCALVAACDLAVASDNARFSLPEMGKDLPPTLAISALGRKVQPKAIASLVLGLASFDALAALRCGLIGEVVASSGLEPRVQEIAAQLAQRNRTAIATVKRYLRATLSPEHESHAELAASLLGSAMATMLASRA